MKVRAHLALMAAVILVPVVALSAVALSMLLRAEREAAQRSARETARSMANTLDRQLATAEATLRALAQSRTLETRDFEGLQQKCAASISIPGTWIAVAEEDGTMVVNTRYPDGRGKQRTDPTLVAKALAAGRPIVSNMFNGRMARSAVVTVEFPVRSAGHAYVLTQVFPPEAFDEAFRDPPAPSSWIVGIFDNDGITVARSQRAAEFVGKRASDSLLASLASAPEGFVRHPTREGRDVYDFWSRSRRSGWAVVVGIPADEVEATARRAVTVAAAGIAVALGAAVLVALLLGRRLSRSIAGTAASAAALSHGRVPAFRPTGIEEVDRLQASLADAGRNLSQEREAREAAEAARAKALELEQAARQLAESRNAAKDEFLAMLGHELRNPLSAITGAVAVLQAPAARDEARVRAREVIARQSGHLGRIVDDLLDLSRVMTGKIRLDLQRVDLAEAVQRCVATLGAAGRTARHAVVVRTASAWVDADPTRLDQVVSNLLVNAVKYTPEGGEVRVEVRAEDHDAVLEVSDDGVGVPEDLKPRIFDVFVQGAASLDRGQGGLGLGLALVKRLVEMHGGSVEVHSEGAGRGSRFTVRLPRLFAPAPSASAGANEEVKGRRLLLVDDHDDARLMLRGLLELRGHDVIEATDGLHAVEQAQREVPEIAVVDIGLPGIDGYEVARRLRADPRTAKIRLIALTGYGQEEDRRRALDAGFDLHMAKPVDEKKIDAAVQRLGGSA